jgi:hypothetical protein
MLSWRSYDVSGQGAGRERVRRDRSSPTASVSIPVRSRSVRAFAVPDKVIACEPHSTFRSAERQNEMRIHVWSRFLLVPRLTDDPGNIEEVA